MIEPLHIVFQDEQHAAVIHLQIPRDQMRTVTQPAIEELMAAVVEQGVGPAGLVFVHLLSQSSETFDFELGVPVTGDVAPTDRVKPGQLPASNVARSVYRGPYDGLVAAREEFGRPAIDELGQQVAAQGLTPGSSIRESYVEGPDSDPDPGTWRTELVAPLVEMTPK